MPGSRCCSWAMRAVSSGADAGAAREDEIGDPPGAFEIGARHRAAGALGQGEFWNSREHRARARVLSALQAPATMAAASAAASPPQTRTGRTRPDMTSEAAVLTEPRPAEAAWRLRSGSESGSSANISRRAENQGSHRDERESLLLELEMHEVERHERRLPEGQGHQNDAHEEAREVREDDSDLGRGQDGQDHDDADVVGLLVQRRLLSVPWSSRSP